MPTRLPESLLSDAMSRLPGWSGGVDGIHRHFVLDAEHARHLGEDIAELADCTGHVIAVAPASDGLDVLLVSLDVDGVSEVDIALATRISDLASGVAARHIPRQRQSQLNGPMPVPLPDVASNEPEPGIEPQQEPR